MARNDCRAFAVLTPRRIATRELSLFAGASKEIFFSFGLSCDETGSAVGLVMFGARSTPVTVTLTCALRPATSVVILNLPGLPEAKVAL